MTMYSSRALRGFASGAASTESPPTQAPWQYQPGYETPPAIDPNGIPYYLDVAPSPPGPAPVGPDGIPYYLAAPEGTSQPLPSWVIPAAIGGGVFVLLGGLGLLFGRRKRRK